MEFLIHQARICPIFLSSDTSPPQNIPHQVTNKEGKICQIAWFARKDTFCNLFFRLAPSAQKGLSATEQNTLVCVAIFVNISSHKILLGPCLISFSTDFYGDGGRSDCCVEHDSILGEKLSVSENQYCQVLYDKDYLAHPLSHWLSSILLIVLLLFFLFLLLKGFSWRLLLCPSPQHLQPPQPLQSPGFKTFINHKSESLYVNVFSY